MLQEERNRRARLETILARHTASEFRCLRDLDKAGFDFRNIEAAYEQLKEDRATDRFTEAQMGAAFAALENQERQAI